VSDLHVACAAEGAYDAHSAAMLHSVLTNGGMPGVHVHYLHGPAFPQRSLARLERMVSGLGGTFVPHAIAPERVARLPVVAEFTVAMWFRILLPELVDADRVLYLDVDTLVLDDLDPLWRTDLSGSYVGAVTNVLMPHHRHRPAQLGLADDAYFNSGVLLMNLEAMRADDCTRAIADYAAAGGPALEWPDQDALNVVLGGRRTPLHPRWNAMNSLQFDWAADVFGAEAVREARDHPAIRHFEGPGQNKPWNRGGDPRDRAQYFAHRRRTPWPGRRLRLKRALRP
jgi:lipopolysaccharide biosynthesis glycosyltransferase